MIDSGRIGWKLCSFVLAVSVMTQPVRAAEDVECSFEKDRLAILAMAGEYRVVFQFNETVGIEPDYKPKEPYHSEATEFIEVIADTGEFISLQHVLVVGGKEGREAMVVKHWRQDWTYQDTEMNVFRGNNTWEYVSSSPSEVVGMWSQAVFQVSDSPRYEAVGRWTHTGARSAWDSEVTWRPLPRREYTKRSDYGVVVARNRHTITPNGWTHEQDNYKLVLDDAGKPKKVLVHETGLNVYSRVDNVDFSAGRTFWDATKPYWQDVRAVWSDILGKPGRVTLLEKVDGERLHRVLLALANEVKEAGVYDADAMAPIVREKIESYIVD